MLQLQIKQLAWKVFESHKTNNCFVVFGGKFMKTQGLHRKSYLVELSRRQHKMLMRISANIIGSPLHSWISSEILIMNSARISFTIHHFDVLQITYHNLRQNFSINSITICVTLKWDEQRAMSECDATRSLYVKLENELCQLMNAHMTLNCVWTVVTSEGSLKMKWRNGLN